MIFIVAFVAVAFSAPRAANVKIGMLSRPYRMEAADKVYNAAAAFGPQHAASADLWLQRALSASAGAMSADELWLAETSSAFSECTLEGGSTDCLKLEESLSGLRTALLTARTWTGSLGEELPRVPPWSMGNVAGSFADAVPESLRQTYQSPLLRAVEDVRRRAAAFGQTQESLAGDWMLEAMLGSDADSESLFERRDLLFDECLLPIDDGDEETDACKALQDALDELQELLGVEDATGTPAVD